MSAAAKTPKTPKIPKPFKGEFTTKAFESTILKRIHVEGEKTFAKGLYQPSPDNPDLVVWVGGLDKKGLDHVKKLAKEIKKNRGVVNLDKFVILGVLIAAGVAASWIFKDQWFEAELEKALTGAFGARADIERLHLDIVGGQVSLESLTVADRAAPMTNLFELGTTGFSIDTWQLLNRKVVIHTMEATDIRFGTARTTSGAVSGLGAGATQTGTAGGAGEAQEAPAFDSTGLLDLDKLDPEAILEAEKSKLKSLAAADAVKAELEAGLVKWPAQWETAQARYKELSTKVDQVRAIDPASLKDVAAIQAAVKTVTELGSQIKESAALASSLAGQAQADYDRATRLISEGTAALGEDYAHLASVIADPAGYGVGLGTALATQVLGPQAWEIQRLAREIPGWLTTIQSATAGEKTAKPVPTARLSVPVYFPARTWPDFVLERLEASVWVSPTVKAGLKVEQVTSDMERTGRPTTFALSYADGTVEAGLDGAVDVRRAAVSTLSAKGQVRGIPVDMGDQLGSLGIRQLRGRFGSTLAMDLGSTGTLVLGAEARLGELQGITKDESITDRIGQRILAQASTVDLGLRATFPAQGAADVQVTTSVDDLIGRVVQESIRDELDRAKVELERLLKEELEAKLAENEALLGAYKEYLSLSNDSLTDTNALGKVVEGQAKKYADAAAKQGQNLLQDAVKSGNLPSVPKVELPKVTLPKFP